jgi:hypothetical protein
VWAILRVHAFECRNHEGEGCLDRPIFEILGRVPGAAGQNRHEPVDRQVFAGQIVGTRPESLRVG